MGTTWAVKMTSVSVVSIYGTCQAFIGTFFAWIVLGEQLEWQQIIGQDPRCRTHTDLLLGAPFILSGLVLSVMEQHKKEKKDRETQYHSVGPEEKPDDKMQVLEVR